MAQDRWRGRTEALRQEVTQIESRIDALEASNADDADAYRFAPHTTANYMAKALRANGHRVYTAGRSAMAPGCKETYRVWGTAQLQAGRAETLILTTWATWRPDLILCGRKAAMDQWDWKA
jgi:hypothetical protein